MDQQDVFLFKNKINTWKVTYKLDIKMQIVEVDSCYLQSKLAFITNRFSQWSLSIASPL